MTAKSKHMKQSSEVLCMIKHVKSPGLPFRQLLSAGQIYVEILSTTNTVVIFSHERIFRPYLLGVTVMLSKDSWTNNNKMTDSACTVMSQQISWRNGFSHVSFKSHETVTLAPFSARVKPVLCPITIRDMDLSQVLVESASQSQIPKWFQNDS